MTDRKLYVGTVRTFALLITLGAAALANAQGTASQPALDSGRPESDVAESQKPADAVAVHEGAGPVDCEALLAQENNTQPGAVSSTGEANQTDGDPASSPYRENMPNEDTQISTLEECREQQQAVPDHQAHDAVKE